ncbi:MAG: hypothetical protein C4581_02160 [Nitrospiraceae bacterium]|nr:MAG: hypothetical protein C4581_02160 [Nitrospiraceae bacterium]
MNNISRRQYETHTHSKHWFSSDILKIPNTLEVIVTCWERAEQRLQYEIDENYPGLNEECITRIFHGLLAKELRKASDEFLIEKEFLRDLKNAFPDADFSQLSGFSSGLIANVTLHERETERITGGDIGLMIVRPKIYCNITPKYDGNYRRGLLCQAKLKDSKGKWGRFSSKQKNVLPERLEYFGLLLYSYKDEERHKLNNFLWQICNSASSFKEVENWSKRDNFPSPVDSGWVIRKVGEEEIGTHDDEILDEIIAPLGNPALIITIDWPNDKRPSTEIYVSSKCEHKIKNIIKRCG